jgi:aminoglycoside phosphotransferase (APT) family kinase protein
MPGEVDVEELAARATAAAQSWAAGCTIDDVQPLTGGASSLTFTAHVDGGPAGAERIVLKVAPPGLAPVRNRDVNRQAKLMRALEGAPGVRVPKVFFEDDGDPPEIPPMHAMNIVPGECLEPILAPLPDEVLPLVPERAFGAVEMLAALHRVDPNAVGLTDEAQTTLEAEVKRWTRAFETVDERMNARYLEADALLMETMPAALPAAICHGDYRLGNMLCDGGRVEALIDWEIWSLSDPRLDLAWFLMFTPEGKHPMARNAGETGMPSADALYARYVQAAGREPDDMEWFHCLIRYKEASATSLLIKRMLKAGGEQAQGNWQSEITSLTAECIERLEKWKDR